jgi:WD40 repeat protein
MGDIREWLASMSPDRLRVTLRQLPQRLARQGDGETFYRLLTDFNFIEAKISHPEFVTKDIIEDYQAALDAGVLFAGEKAETLRLIQGAIRLSAHILEEDKTQLTGQLWGRLLSFDLSEIREMLEVAKHRQAALWLRPLTASLTAPGGALLRTLTGHTDWVNAVAIEPSGKFAVSGSYDSTLKVWDLDSGRELKTLSGHTKSVTAVAIAPDGKFAVSASDDYTLKVWDFDSGNELKTLTGHTFSVNGVAIAPSCKIAVSASEDNTLKVWDLASGKEITTFTGDSNILCCAIAPDGVTIVAGDSLGRVHFLRLEGLTQPEF